MDLQLYLSKLALNPCKIEGCLLLLMFKIVGLVVQLDPQAKNGILVFIPCCILIFTYHKSSICWLTVIFPPRYSCPMLS